MKNILLITNIYPNNDPDYKGTPVCHTFAKEWKAMGYNVRAIHFGSVFPRLFTIIGKLFEDRIRAKTGFVTYTKYPRKLSKYEVDGIPVLFSPLKKIIPHTSPSERRMLKSFNLLCSSLEKDGFIPDVVTGHFVMPQLEILSLFKKRYPQVRTCLVLHGSWTFLRSEYPNRYETFMKSVDIWGFRSLPFQLDFEKQFGKNKPMFLCHSGIPEKYIEGIKRVFCNGVKHFVFVGSLIELKNVDITLHALHKALSGKDYTFDIVGSGEEDKKLHRLVEELGMTDHVIFHGQKNRDDVQNILRKADCFIMVSSREAFGLVYVEAMAKGCIIVGTKGQGIDGIVKHGENGFLCKARDVDGLADVVNQIVSLSPADLQQISSKAVSTAADLTDRKVAEHYINAVLHSE